MPKAFNLHISTEGAAFADAPAAEIARILREAAQSIEEDGHERVGRLKDINGNRVGFWSHPRPGEEGDTNA